jgi:hypothetical protein
MTRDASGKTGLGRRCAEHNTSLATLDLWDCGTRNQGAGTQNYLTSPLLATIWQFGKFRPVFAIFGLKNVVNSKNFVGVFRFRFQSHKIGRGLCKLYFWSCGQTSVRVPLNFPMRKENGGGRCLERTGLTRNFPVLPGREPSKQGRLPASLRKYGEKSAQHKTRR